MGYFVPERSGRARRRHGRPSVSSARSDARRVDGHRTASACGCSIPTSTGSSAASTCSARWRRRARRVLHRRLPAHARQGDPAGPATRSSTSGCPTSRRRSTATRCVTGWEENTVVGIADVALARASPRRGTRATSCGEAVEAVARMGLEPQIAFELEFYLLEPDGGGGWRPVSLPGAPRLRHRHVGRPDRHASTTMVNTALACGFPVESWSSEYDNAAYEVNIRYDDAIPAADEAFLFRLLVREIAERHGKLATFLGRPLDDRGGSGMHVNFSVPPRGRLERVPRPERPGGALGPGAPVRRGAARASRGDGGDHGPARERLQAAAARHAERLLGELGPRRPQRRGARAAGARRGHAARAADGRRRREPVPRGRRGACTRRASAWRRSWSCGRRSRSARSPTPTCGSRRTWTPRSKRSNGRRTAGGGDRPELVEAFTILKRGEWERYMARRTRTPTRTEVTDWELGYYLPFH